MTHLPVLPIVVPLATAALLIISAHAAARVRRIVSLVSVASSLLIALVLAARADDGAHFVYRVGAWREAFGIVVVVDRMSAAMVVLASIVTLAAIAQAARGADERSRHFHAFVHLQLAGVNGAFVTGDFFNLFVFFEVLLIASYCLLLHGKGERRVRAAVHYVTLNLVGSAVFLVALGVLYGATGALNMAAVSDALVHADPATRRLVSAAAALFAVVFGLKAAVVPVHFWLAGVYSSARPEVSASFAILTKVGVYCIARLLTLLPTATGDLVSWLLPAALATQVLGSIGALATRDPARMQAYLLVSSVGFMLTGIALLERGALPAGLFYLAHSTVTVASAFIVVDAASRPSRRVVAGVCYVVVSIAVVGLPPLSGFIGKAALLSVVPVGGAGAAAIAAVLFSSFIGLAACARTGIALFWDPGTRADEPLAGTSARSATSGLGVPAALFVVLGALTVFAGPAMSYATRAADQLRDRGAYVAAVLGAGRS